MEAQQSPLLPLSEWAEIAGRALRRNNVQVTKAEVRPYKDEVAGFLGGHFKVTLGVPGKDDLQFFVKVVPEQGSTHAVMVEEMRCFENEIEFYQQVLPELMRGAASLWTSKCYFSRPGLLVLEDLALSGFVGVEARLGLDVKHIAVALDTLASFHAASLALERRLGCTMDEIFSSVCQDNIGFESQTGMFGGFFRAFKKASCALLELLPSYGLGTPHHEEIKALIPATCDRLPELVRPSAAHRNVLCHADVWVNNFLFRHDSHNGRPVEARMVDFQLTRYAPPAHDVAMLLYLVCPREQRREHLEDLLRHYHGRLEAALRGRGLSPEEELIGWQQFRLAFEEHAVAGMAIACLNHQITMMPAASAKELVGSASPEQFKRFWSQDRDEEMRLFFYTDADFRRWATQDLEELIESYILPQVVQKQETSPCDSKDASFQTVSNFLRPLLVEGKD